MRTKSTIGLAGLLATVAMAAMTVGASAAGATEFRTGSGAFPDAFAGEGGEAEVESSGGNVVACGESSSEGEIMSSTEAQIVVTFSGNCEAKGIVNAACAEPITTEVLSMEPVSISVGSGRGLLFKSAAGAVIADLTCGGTALTLEGEVVCEAAGPYVSSYATTGEVICGAGHGSQNLQMASLFINESATLSMTETLTFAESIHV